MKYMVMLLGNGSPKDWGELTSEAFAQATAQWGQRGVPDNPAGWLHRVAQRRIADALRRETTAAAKAPL